jgi:DNA-directed RNA polymerase subunit RPC12/RpoP
MAAGKYSEVRKKDWFQTALLLFIFITVSSVSAIFLLPGYWYFWLLTILALLILLLEWHARNFAYRCPRCGKIFEISALEGLLGPNSINKKYLNCPLCRKKAWADILRIEEASFLRNKLLFEEQNNTGHEKRKG